MIKDKEKESISFVSVGFSVDVLLGNRVKKSSLSFYLWQRNIMNRHPSVSIIYMFSKVLSHYALLSILSQDINGKLFLPKYALTQDVCTYRDFIYRTVEIPGCPHHVAPYFSYPVAVSCKCGKCNTDYSDCVHEAIKTNYCTKPQKSYLLGFSV